MWSPSSMKLAINGVLEDKMTIREAAACFGVPKSTLASRVKLLTSGAEITLRPFVGMYRTVFSEEQELDFYNHTKKFKNPAKPFSKIQVREMDYQFVEEAKIKHNSNKEQKMAGTDFYCYIVRKYPDLLSTNPQDKYNESKDPPDVEFVNTDEPNGSD